MTMITITLSAAQSRALAFHELDPAFLFQSQAEARANAAIEEIVALEVQRCLDAGEPVPATREAIVAQAFQRGTVRTVAERAAVPPPEPPRPVPFVISDRQFAQGLANRGIIAKAEALAFVQTGTIPAALQAIVDAIADEDERFAAELLISGATSFQRQHPLTDAIGAAYGWNAEAIDAFWRECAAL